MEKTRYIFKFYYIGSKKYHGSQRQPDYLTVEECLLSALKERKYIKDDKTSGFEVASRTDKYVSARGSTFSFETEKKPILMEINTALPKNIGIWGYSEVPIDFLSRYNALYRHYKYIVPYSINFRRKIASNNLNEMIKACRTFEGRHDFRNFFKPEKDNEKTIRDIMLASLRLDGDFLIFDFKSRAFLRQQIRRMIAKIFELGLEIITFEEFLDLFNPSRTYSYQPADPLGLILWDINYGKKMQFTIDAKSKERMNKFFLRQEIKFSTKQKLFSLMQRNNISEKGL
ncbi:MAG: tRNA pseudouridine(38-40) synthase TruA [Candidatus Lokiarchaeota archaeon]|nr:tRNA pseudouridine(38-40) synthase TruA [Candidatus Lokiarchaeota archaeon]